MTQSERFGIIERMLLARRGVRFEELMERLEVSRATLHRDLRDLKERMQVPIVCDRSTGVYRIDHTVERYELPGVWFSPREIHALLSMQQLLNSVDKAGLLAEHVVPIRQRLIGMLESRADSADAIAKRIRIIGVAARSYAPQHFQSIAAALMERRRVNLAYAARSSGASSQREVSPQRLIYYRGNWYLDAWCHQREGLRSFAIDAILSAKDNARPAVDIPDDALDATLGAGYGIFAGRDVRWATLKFTAERARWVAAEQWHPEQNGSFLEDGCYQLQVPYSNDPELIMDVLKYGPDCEVVGPGDLREKVMGLLMQAAERYADDQ